jgi:predicted  nucleic acid-binding Zn-ribbon protein
MMDFDPKKLRARFAELTEKHDAIRAKADPLRERYDALVQGNRKAEDAAAKRVKNAEDGLYEIEMERAAIARALGGRTAEPAE